MAEPTNATPDNVDLVVPQDVAPSGHGGSGPAPMPHPLTEEANKPSKPGEVSDPDNADSGPVDEDE